MVMWICLTFSPEFTGDPLGNQKVCLIHLLFAILRRKKRHSNVSAHGSRGLGWRAGRVIVQCS